MFIAIDADRHARDISGLIQAGLPNVSMALRSLSLFPRPEIHSL